MTTSSAADLYRHDRQAYLAAFWQLEDDHEWSEDALALVNGLGYFLNQERYEGMPDVVAMGYLAGQLEEWREEELAEHRISTIWREEIEADMATKFTDEWDREAWARITYSVFNLNNRLEDFCFDRERLNDRLGFLCDAVGERVFDRGFFEETRSHWHYFHRFGTALFLYMRWLSLMDELNVPEHERWTENVQARPISDELLALDLPLEINGCELRREDIVGGYEIRSSGRLGGGHWMRFRALRDTAEIVIIVTEGRLGTRTVGVPEPRNVDVLRELGFTKMVWPNGKRYELRTWPGVRRIRD